MCTVVPSSDAGHSFGGGKQGGTAEHLQQNPLSVLKLLYHIRLLLYTPCLLQIVTVTKILDVSELGSWISINCY